MKKVLVVLLMAAVVSGAFAQVDFSVSGGVRSDLGISIDFGKAGSTEVDGPGKEASNSWFLGAGDASISVSGSSGPVSAGVTFQGNSGNVELDGYYAAVNFNPVELRVGLGELPWRLGSPVDFKGFNNYGEGDSAVKDQFIQIKYATDTMSIYGGLLSAGLVGEIPMRDEGIFPGFFIGGDYDGGMFTVGLGFAGVPRGKGWIGDRPSIPSWAGEMIADSGLFDSTPAYTTSRFAWMANLHGQVKLDPITIGINFGMYGDPTAYSGFKVKGVDTGATDMDGADKKNKDFLIEAMLSAGVALDPCDVGLSVAFLANTASKELSNGDTAAAMVIGASATFKAGGGFRIIPGLVVRLPVAFAKGSADSAPKPGDDGTFKGSMDLGISFGWSF